MARYKAFDVNPCLLRYVACRFGKGRLLKELLDRCNVLVAFHSTVTNTKWATNLMSSLTSVSFEQLDPHLDVTVDSGFLSLYTSSNGAAKFGHGSCHEQLLKSSAGS
ncbi:hypothetical protein Cni_G12600 [Canna indica]|uniref:Uncharacterized protein n=1 Tax=Canna indica TaxID=4628 RepID=A0AAQ3K8L6_9LILI|nr:hypothetical protein Cni_G12600 [Canna indica]